MVNNNKQDIFLPDYRREAPLFSNGFSPGGNFVTDELLCPVLQQTKVSIYISDELSILSVWLCVLYRTDTQLLQHIIQQNMLLYVLHQPVNVTIRCQDKNRNNT